MHQAHDLHASLVDRPNGHDQRIHHHVACRDAVVGSALNNFLGYCKAHVWVLRDTGLVVGNSHYRSAVFFHQRQHSFQAVFLSGDRVDQRLAFVHRQTRFQGGDDGRVNGNGNVGYALH